MTIYSSRFLVIACVAHLVIVSFAKAQTALEIFGSREIISCSSTTQPEQGPITAEIARRYVICQKEHMQTGTVNRINLIGEIKIELGRSTPINPGDLMRLSNAHSEGIYHALRGHYTSYLCSKVVPMNIGKNCDLSVIPQAERYCYRMTFGDWACNLFTDKTGVINTTSRVPPPQRAPE